VLDLEISPWLFTAVTDLESLLRSRAVSQVNICRPVVMFVGRD